MIDVMLLTFIEWGTSMLPTGNMHGEATASRNKKYFVYYYKFVSKK